MRILQSNPLRKKWGKVEKNSQKAFKKAKTRALKILQGTPLQKKRSKVKKTAKRPSKKAKERAFESGREGFAIKKSSARNAQEGLAASPLTKSKRDAGKASLRLGRLGLLGSHARTHRAIGFEASKSSPNRHVFRLHGRFRHPTSLGRRGFIAHPAVYSSTYMFNGTPAAGSAARPGCVLVYLYVQPHIGRAFTMRSAAV